MGRKYIALGAATKNIIARDKLGVKRNASRLIVIAFAALHKSFVDPLVKGEVC